MNSRMPNVSILMPVKNAAEYLTECIESVIEQTYTDWELIAVNDHSNDHSADILYNFSIKDPRIKVVNNKGNGIICH